MRDRCCEFVTGIWNLYLDKKLDSLIHKKQQLQKSLTVFPKTLLSFKKFSVKRYTDLLSINSKIISN